MTTSRTHVRSRLAAGAALVGALVLVASPAWAHVDPDPATVPAGSTETVSFGVEHGCEDAATTKVEIKVPDGVTGVVPDDDAAPSGWTGAVEGDVVAFEGPAQPSADGFDVAFSATFPATEGAVSFPLIQTCEDGSSISWIDPVVEGGAEPEHPAPTVTLGAAVGGQEATTTTTAAATTTTVATTVAETTTTVTAVPAGGESIDQAAPDADDGDDDGGSSDTGLLIGGAIAAVVVLGGVVAYVLRRQSGGRTGPTGDGA